MSEECPKNIHEECPKNTGACEKKNLKKPSQTSRGVPKCAKPIIEVSNSNPFEVLNSVDNDVELVGKLFLWMKKVECPGDYDREDEIASVDNDMAHSMASERVGFGTQSLLEQWRDSYGNGDYDEDPYNDDMYEGQDLPQQLQAICDNLDIRVRGRKKK
ncbi:hypothetical protein Tco_1290687 [Tanacetum coccineum]